jgi:hypothetical protein
LLVEFEGRGGGGSSALHFPGEPVEEDRTTDASAGFISMVVTATEGTFGCEDRDWFAWRKSPLITPKTVAAVMTRNSFMLHSFANSSQFELAILNFIYRYIRYI